MTRRLFLRLIGVAATWWPRSTRPRKDRRDIVVTTASGTARLRNALTILG